MKTTYAPFDVADYLNNDEVITEYLSAAASDPNTEVFIAALRDVAKFGSAVRVGAAPGFGALALLAEG